MNEEELFYALALSQIKGIGPRNAKRLIALCGDVKKVFKTPLREIEDLDELAKRSLKKIRKFKDFNRIEKEISFIQKYKVSTRFYLDENYPFRLKFCQDAPILLFGSGNIKWNPTRCISIVGTRQASKYGEEQVNKIVEGLKEANVCIVSGMAYGIDVLAHRAAIRNGLESTAVVAHGMDRIYPSLHKDTLLKMMNNGGMISEFLSETIPDRENFPKRNRIIAGFSDATLVVESAAKGGSMITAELAASYNRDVFAVPGNNGAQFSEGCNYLIHTQKAGLIRGASDILKIMNWKKESTTKKKQTELFVDLSQEEQHILNLLNEKGKLGIDQISINCSYPVSKTSVLLLELEFKGLVISLPGKIYKLI